MGDFNSSNLPQAGEVLSRSQSLKTAVDKHKDVIILKGRVV